MLSVALLVLLVPQCVTRDLNRAKQLLESGDFLRARKIYARVLDRAPESFPAHFGLAMTWCAEAISKTDLHLAEPADWYPAIYHMTVAANQGGSDQARETLAILHFNLGACFRKKGDNEAAIERIEEAILHDTTLLKAYNLLGVIYHEQGDLVGAQSCYRRTVELQPDYAPAHFNLGSVSWARGDYVSAQTHFGKAASLAPENAYFRSWLGKAKDRVVAPKEKRAGKHS